MLDELLMVSWSLLLYIYICLLANTCKLPSACCLLVIHGKEQNGSVLCCDYVVVHNFLKFQP